ncbi:hypothetical protein F5Y14DRAFT_450816 [Nemania sp. NC0429]|nr:hypothetical protein F5Y14DRAFT_450816 [Nemania sp. NC0429]
MDVQSTVRFLKPSLKLLSERPYDLRYPLLGEDGKPYPKTNYDRVDIDITIHDMRPRKHKLSLGREGFVVLDLDSGLKPQDYFDREKVKESLVARLRPALIELLGARGVYFHETVVRSRDVQTITSENGENKVEFNGPIPQPHVDYTLDELHRIVETLSGEKLPEGARVQSINAWLPLSGPLQDWPLALCDASTASLGDFHVHDGVIPHAIIESYRISHNAKQKWYYLSDQLPSEVLVFNTMDSAGLYSPGNIIVLILKETNEY